MPEYDVDDTKITIMSPISKSCQQHFNIVNNIPILPSTHIVSNIRHRHDVDNIDITSGDLLIRLTKFLRNFKKRVFQTHDVSFEKIEPKPILSQKTNQKSTP